MSRFLKKLAWVVSLSAAVLAAPVAQAQGYPNKPIRLICPFPLAAPWTSLRAPSPPSCPRIWANP